jgi:hypothetical protein
MSPFDAAKNLSPTKKNAFDKCPLKNSIEAKEAFPSFFNVY